MEDPCSSTDWTSVLYAKSLESVMTRLKILLGKNNLRRAFFINRMKKARRKLSIRWFQFSELLIVSPVDVYLVVFVYSPVIISAPDTCEI